MSAKTKLNEITEDKMAGVACLLDLLSDHPDVQDNPKLYGALAAIQGQFMGVWNELDAELDRLAGMGQ